MSTLLKVSLLILMLISTALAQSNTAQPDKKPAGELIKITPEKGASFHWPYYLYIPASLSSLPEKPAKNHLIVLPNNTGTTNDDLQFHDDNAKKKMENNQTLAELLKLPILKPVFPRPENQPKLYTHALDRDALLTSDEKLARLDLQLIAMITDAAGQMARRGIQIDKRVILAGFSASGMFVNRFALLHPDYVLAAAIGSPGGWPILPIESWQGRPLRYPIGIADIKKITGESVDLTAFKSLPLFFYLGDQDTNDSVVFTDGYDKEDRDLIFENFGATPVARWSIVEKIYKDAGCTNAKFVLYKGVGHFISGEMQKDLLAFINEALKGK